MNNIDKKKYDYPIEFRPSKLARIIIGFTVFFLIAYVCFGTTLWILTINDLATSSNLSWATIAIRIITPFVLYALVSVIYQLLIFIYHQALIITVDGIWFVSSKTYFYTWDKMLKFGYHPKTRKADFVGGIKTKYTQAKSIRPMRKWLFSIWTYENFIPIETFTRIPRSLIFTHNIEKFMKTDFGQILYDHAPHLFADVDKPKRQKSVITYDDLR